MLFAFAACHNNDNTQDDAATQKTKNALPQVSRLQQLLQQHPDSTGLRLALAIQLDSSSQYPQALAHMDTLIKNDSTNYGLWYTKGAISEHSKDTVQALANYMHAIQLYASPDALLAVANLYAEQKNERSVQICSQVSKMGLGRDYDAASSFITGVYYARTGDRQQALKMFDKTIANSYTYMEAYIEKGLVYFDNKQYREALAVFNFASTVNRLYPDAYYYMARCYEIMNVKDSAVFYFKQSQALDNAPETRAALKRVGG